MAGVQASFDGVLAHMRASVAIHGVADTDQSKARVMSLLAGAPSVTVSAATEMLQALATSVFPQSDKAEIANVINEKIAQVITPSAAAVAPPLVLASGPPPRQFNQSCLFFQRFLDEACWQVLTDPASSWQRILVAIGRRCQALGLLWPTETTLLQMWCVVLATRTPAGSQIAIDPVAAWEKKREIKEHLEGLRGLGLRQGHFGQVKDYPSNPADLQTTHPQTYDQAYPSGSTPQPCPTDETLISVARHYLPCRSSHRSLTGASTAISRARRGLSNRVVTADRALTAEASGGIPGLVIFDRPRPATPQHAQHARQEDSALAVRAPHQQHQGTLLALPPPSTPTTPAGTPQTPSTLRSAGSAEAQGGSPLAPASTLTLRHLRFKPWLGLPLLLRRLP